MFAEYIRQQVKEEMREFAEELKQLGRDEGKRAVILFVAEKMLMEKMDHSVIERVTELSKGEIDALAVGLGLLQSGNTNRTNSDTP